MGFTDVLRVARIIFKNRSSSLALSDSWFGFGSLGSQRACGPLDFAIEFGLSLVLVLVLFNGSFAFWRSCKSPICVLSILIYREKRNQLFRNLEMAPNSNSSCRNLSVGFE